MTRPEATKSRAATAAFFLFAAVLVLGLAFGATRAEASLPRTDDAGLAPIRGADESTVTFDDAAPHAVTSPRSDPRRGFASSLELLAPEKEPPGFGLFSCPETRRCERTYARNNPLKYVDPDGNAPQEAASTADEAYEQIVYRALHPEPLISPDSAVGKLLGGLVDPFGTMGEGVEQGDPTTFGIGFIGFGLGIAVDRSGRLTETPGVVTRVYSRPSGATTRAQRATVQGKPCVDCGTLAPKMVADHIEPLAKEHYRTGSIDKQRMRDVKSVQPQCPTCSAKQGGFLSGFSKLVRKVLGLE